MNIYYILTYPLYIYKYPTPKLHATVAHWLADSTKWTTDNKEILLIADINGWTVAHWLACHSYITHWRTDDKEILLAADKYERTVAYVLAHI